MSLKNFRSRETPASDEQQPKVYAWDHRSSTGVPADWLKEGDDPSSLNSVVYTPGTLFEWAKSFATFTGTDPNEIAAMSYEDVVELAGNGAYGEGNWVVCKNPASEQPVVGWQGRPETSQVLLDLVSRPQQA